MKKIKFLLPILCTLLCFTLTVSAHSGKTDSNGGHYDRSTGEYHYHHGFPAHDHENGECPYDFVNNEKDSYNSGNSNSDDEDEEYYITEERTTGAVEYDESKTNDFSWFEIVFFSLLGTIIPASFTISFIIFLFETVKDKFFKYSDDYTLTVGVISFVAEWFCIIFFFLKEFLIGIITLLSVLLITFIVWCIVSKISNDKGYQKHLEDERIKEEQRRLEEVEHQRKIAERKRIFNKEREKYLIYENKNKTEIFNIYFKTKINIIFDDKNLPVPLENQDKFGEYTVFTSHSGNRFHYKKGCSGATIPNSIFKISRRYYSECGKCMGRKKELPITEHQYSNFISLLTNLDYYNINIKDYDTK